jgi:hypothetical protein
MSRERPAAEEPRFLRRSIVALTTAATIVGGALSYVQLHVSNVQTDLTKAQILRSEIDLFEQEYRAMDELATSLLDEGERPLGALEGEEAGELRLARQRSRVETEVRHARVGFESVAARPPLLATLDPLAERLVAALGLETRLRPALAALKKVQADAASGSWAEQKSARDLTAQYVTARQAALEAVASFRTSCEDEIAARRRRLRELGGAGLDG